MLKATRWISAMIAPVLLTTAGCSMIGNPVSSSRRTLAPDRLMSMAQTFERQGHLKQAKAAYEEVLASQPENPDAKQGLERMIAGGAGLNDRKTFRGAIPSSQQYLAQSKKSGKVLRRSRSASEEAIDSPSIETASTTPAAEFELRAHEDRGLSASDPFPNSAEPISRVGVAMTPAVAATRSIVAAKPTVATPTETFVDSEAQQEIVEVPRESLEPSVTEASRVARTRSGIREDLLGDDPQEPMFLDEEPETPILVARDDLTEPDSALADNLPAPESLPESLGDLDEVGGAEQQAHANSTVVPTVATGSDSAFASPTAIAESSVFPEEVDASESTRFEQPIVRREIATDGELNAYLGTFNVKMIKNAKADRIRIQPKLAELLADRDASADDRTRATFLLGAIGPDAIEVLPLLRREMREAADDYRRVDLAEAILKIHSEDREAIEALIECLKDNDENVKWVAAFALRSAVSPRTTYVIDALRQALATDDLKLRRMVFLTLAEFGPAAVNAVPEIEAALNSPDAATREVAAASLACIVPGRGNQ